MREVSLSEAINIAREAKPFHQGVFWISKNNLHQYWAHWNEPIKTMYGYDHALFPCYCFDLKITEIKDIDWKDSYIKVFEDNTFQFLSLPFHCQNSVPEFENGKIYLIESGGELQTAKYLSACDCFTGLFGGDWNKDDDDGKYYNTLNSEQYQHITKVYDISGLIPIRGW